VEVECRIGSLAQPNFGRRRYGDSYGEASSPGGVFLGFGYAEKPRATDEVRMRRGLERYGELIGTFGWTLAAGGDPRHPRGYGVMSTHAVVVEEKVVVSRTDPESHASLRALRAAGSISGRRAPAGERASSVRKPRCTDPHPVYTALAQGFLMCAVEHA
jgi:hypothetical protein